MPRATVTCLPTPPSPPPPPQLSTPPPGCSYLTAVQVTRSTRSEHLATGSPPISQITTRSPNNDPRKTGPAGVRQPLGTPLDDGQIHQCRRAAGVPLPGRFYRRPGSHAGGNGASGREQPVVNWLDMILSRNQHVMSFIWVSFRTRRTRKKGGSQLEVGDMGTKTAGWFLSCVSWRQKSGAYILLVVICLCLLGCSKQQQFMLCISNAESLQETKVPVTKQNSIGLSYSLALSIILTARSLFE